MNTNIEIIEDDYNWTKLSLWKFLDEGNIPKGWEEFFLRKDVQQHLCSISEDIDLVRKTKTIFPPLNQVFRAFYLVPLENIRAIVVGQDPYHNGSAIGLCFSVKHGNKLNPSMLNIYKELELEGFSPDKNGDLTHWAKQGVLMLNMALTVEKADAGSHSCIWKQFSRLLIQYISEKRGDDIDWLLFGKDAHAVVNKLQQGKFHLTSHPSPFSANRSGSNYPSFIGSNVFKKVCDIKW